MAAAYGAKPVRARRWRVRKPANARILRPRAGTREVGLGRTAIALG